MRDEVFIIMPQNNFCEICKKNFSKLSNLRAHAKKFHPDKAAEIAPQKQFRVTAFCKECSKTFSTYANYIRHLNNFHNDKTNIVTSGRLFNFKCAVCQKNFSHKRHFKFHSKMHQPTSVNSHHRVLKKCPLCTYAEFSSQQLLNHFQSLHELTINLEDLEFPSFEEFMQWKTDIEEKDCVSFTNTIGICRNLNSSQRIYYRCHRSGIFKTRGQCIRHRRSNKINGYCPSGIKLIISKSGNCKVTWIQTHIGHDTDLGHLKLPAAKKKQLACKIASKIPFNQQLNNQDNTKIIGAFSEMKKEHRDLDAEKEKLIAFFLQTVHRITSIEELDAVKDIAASINPVLDAVQNKIGRKSLLPSNFNLAPHNKKIEAQKCFMPVNNINIV